MLAGLSLMIITSADYAYCYMLNVMLTYFCRINNGKISLEQCEISHDVEASMFKDSRDKRVEAD